MRHLFTIILLWLLSFTPLMANQKKNDYGNETEVPAKKSESYTTEKETVEKEHTFVHKLLLYIPNRLFDSLDFVRARLRLGPGIGLGLRATKIASVYLGSYTSAYIGLRGPRRHPEIPWPFGADSNSGIQLSLINETTDKPEDKSAPAYGLLEFGADVQVILLGMALGVEPLEVLDFVSGIFFIDICKDDL